MSWGMDPSNPAYLLNPNTQLYHTFVPKVLHVVYIGPRPLQASFLELWVIKPTSNVCSWHRMLVGLIHMYMRGIHIHLKKIQLAQRSNPIHQSRMRSYAMMVKIILEISGLVDSKDQVRGLRSTNNLSQTQLREGEWKGQLQSLYKQHSQTDSQHNLDWPLQRDPNHPLPSTQHGQEKDWLQKAIFANARNCFFQKGKDERLVCSKYIICTVIGANLLLECSSSIILRRSWLQLVLKGWNHLI